MRFHDSIQQWFEREFREPTAVQSASWPVIARGENALITAPTGSGKTLTAFLWALNRFATGETPTGSTRVLYVSPLKALNNDIERNLLGPLASLEADFGYPHLRVRTRSGDTSQGDRQRMVRQPPDILITTPESLGLLLTSARSRQTLRHVETVIIDEVHSLVENRRGVQLMVNLERLADLADGVQRVALSATVHPLQTVADYVAGREANGQVRPMQIINPAGTKKLEFRVRFPDAARTAVADGKKIWDTLSDDFREIIGANQSTLFFTNSRRLAEKITLKINETEPAPLAYAHHGSLAREVRNEVESRLKAGTLKAIVATNSLEMGIDIGHLDEVVMVQSPPSVAATLQRIGRAGHRVGEVSVGTLYPSHAQDFLEAAVLAEAVAERDIEPLQPVYGALDVLAQIIVSICATDPWPLDRLYGLIVRASPYAALAREHFDLVIEMLSGRYAGARVRELKPRLAHDRIAHTVKANRGAVLALYLSGGTIPDRGYFQMRHLDTGGVLGELDEEFVWEATVGDTFTMGTQHWQVHRITHNDVIVRPARPGRSAPPFWRAETINRSCHFSDRIGAFLESADADLTAGRAQDLQRRLEQACGFEHTAAEELVDYLSRQREHTNAPLPHRHHLLVERVRAGPAGYQGPDEPRQIVLHTCWGGRLNHPYALALRAAWRRRYQTRLDIHADNNAIVLQVRGDIQAEDVLSLVSAENLPELLRESLEHSGFFGARFRECAGRALLLTRQRFNQRLPLWMSRLQAKKLMTSVASLSDFPVMLETWRTCLDDEFDLPNLIGRLNELHNGSLTWRLVTTTTPSPFAQVLTFSQVSRYMYADDTPEREDPSALDGDLISQVLHNDALRPRIEAAIVDEFEAKRQRRWPGYPPESDEDWAEWLKERVLIPLAELPEDFVPPTQAARIEHDDRAWLCHIETAASLYESGLAPGPMPDDLPHVDDTRTAEQFAREILSFYGPRSETQIVHLLPSVPDGLLEPDETFIHGRLCAELESSVWCDAGNFETLMRMQRAQRRSSFAPKSVSEMTAWWAGLHELQQTSSETGLAHTLETLRGFPADVQVWLEDIVPARATGTSPADLQLALQGADLGWLGCGKRQITLVYPEERDLMATGASRTDLAAGFADPLAGYTFQQVADQLNTTPATLNERWWPAVWQGQLVCDSVLPLVQGLQRKFALDSVTNTTSRRRLRTAPRDWPGTWRLGEATPADDALARLEADKERVRLLLDRYGLINREIVNRERLPAGAADPDKPALWRWRDAFRALRIMELSGEVFSGHFVEALDTPQFISPRGFSQLQAQTPQRADFWVACTDPAAPTGLGVQTLADMPLPHRRPGNYLAFHDGNLAVTVSGYGKQLCFAASADDAALDAQFAVLHHVLALRKRVEIATINGEPARSSPYLAALERHFQLAQDHRHVFLQTAL